MWLFIPGGFVSIVASREQPDWLVVRARKQEHLENFQRGGRSGYPITTTPDADYRFRMTVPRSFVQGLVRRAVAQIDYTNFKDAAHDAQPKDEDWSRALGNIWLEMYELQDPSVRAPLRFLNPNLTKEM